jgi:hypothetical protein
MITDEEINTNVRVGSHDAYGQSRTDCLASAATREAAFRRLAVAILRLDVASLANELASARRAADIGARIAA